MHTFSIGKDFPRNFLGFPSKNSENSVEMPRQFNELFASHEFQVVYMELVTDYFAEFL